MSMFDRKIKLQFNKMKYHNNAHPNPIIINPPMELKKVVRGRIYMFYLGLGTGYGLLNYDVFKYKTTRGLARWKKRVTEFLGLSDNGHGHGHGHGHGDSNKSHGNNSHDKGHGHGEEKSHGHH